MDKPIPARMTYSDVEHPIDEELIRQRRSNIALSAEVYKLYSEHKRKAGFTEDDSFISSLIALVAGADAAPRQTPADAHRIAGVLDNDNIERNPAKVPSVDSGMSKTEDVDEATVNVERSISFLEGSTTKVGKSVSIAEHANTKVVKSVSIAEGISTKVGKSASIVEGISTRVGKSVSISEYPATTIISESGSDLDAVVCDRCGEELINSEALEEHTKSCDPLAKYRDVPEPPPTPRYIYCRCCSMRCNNQLEYKKHYHRYHETHSDYHICPYCNKKQAFSEKRLLKNHYKTEPVCLSCQKRFTKLKDLEVHIRNRKHDKDRKKERSHKLLAGRKMQHVPPVVEAMEKAQQPNLPSGFSFMSVRMNPLHRLPDPEAEGVLYVPETAYRQGYVLRSNFTATPFPELFTEEDTEDEENDFSE